MTSQSAVSLPLFMPPLWRHLLPPLPTHLLVPLPSGRQPEACRAQPRAVPHVVVGVEPRQLEHVSHELAHHVILALHQAGLGPLQLQLDRQVHDLQLHL